MYDERLIACELVPINEYDTIESEKKRFGRYHGTNFWNVKDYGRKTWIVGARLKVLDPQSTYGLCEKEVIEACFRYLNTPPPRKKYAKKNPTPRYGNLGLYSYKRVFTSNTEELIDPPSVFSVLFKVDRSKSKFFWGRGKNV